MKILVGVDGSEMSQKALAEAAKIAKGCKSDEITVLLVSNPEDDFSFFPYEFASADLVENYQIILKEHEKEAKKILLKSRKFLEEQNLKGRTLLKCGHPANTIVKIAEEEGFDMIVLGNRGFGGLKKLLLGSVSNAVVQEIKDCNVLIVK